MDSGEKLIIKLHFGEGRESLEREREREESVADWITGTRVRVNETRCDLERSTERDFSLTEFKGPPSSPELPRYRWYY
jgi:hypothetical protein